MYLFKEDILYCSSIINDPAFLSPALQDNTAVVEFDFVEGVNGGKVLLTMMFRNCYLMLAFLLDSKTQENVQRVSDELTEQLGIINSEARDSLNICTPYQLSQLLLSNQLHSLLSLEAIPPDELIIFK
jgi:hypothetical protein